MTASFHWHPDTRLIAPPPDLTALATLVRAGTGLRAGQGDIVPCGFAAGY